MDWTIENGGRIHVDLSLATDAAEMLRGEGQHGKTITAAELRHIRGRWPHFRGHTVVWRQLKVTALGVWGLRLTSGAADALFAATELPLPLAAE